MLSAASGAVGAHCVAALCQTPSPDMSALVLQRVQREMARGAPTPDGALLHGHLHSVEVNDALIDLSGW